MAWVAQRFDMSKRRCLNRVRRAILSSLSFTDTNGIHYHSLCLTSLSPGFAAFLVDADETVKKPRRNAPIDLLNRISTLVVYC